MQKSELANIPLFLLLLSLSLAIFGSDRLGLFNPAKDILGYISVPIQKTIFGVSETFKTEFSNLLFVQQIAQDYQNLKAQNGKLIDDNNKLKAVQEENKILRAQFESGTDLAKSLLPAHVIGLAKNLLVDQGSKAGVKTGQIVVLENSLIGQVIEVAPNSSTVRLPISPQSSITVFVDNTGGPKGVVNGSFGSTMVLEKILPEEKLEVGQLVLVAGEENQGNIPKGLILGKIAGIKKEEAAVFQSAEIEPIFPFDQLTTVFIKVS